METPGQRVPTAASVRLRCEHAFVAEMNSNQKGATAELAIAKEASRLGLGVYWPLVEHGRCDLILECDGALIRVQCKWSPLRGDVIDVRIATSRHTPLNGYLRTTYSASEVDAIGVYCRELDRCYLIPIAVASGRSGFCLRLRAAKNNQQAAVNYAADYEFEGAVAQLARAIGWQPVGRGFESLQLHDSGPGIAVVGSEEFRQHSPRYVQRAEAGESFLVTRRGKPMARLVPVREDGLDGDLAQPPLLEEQGGAEAA